MLEFSRAISRAWPARPARHALPMAAAAGAGAAGAAGAAAALAELQRGGALEHRRPCPQPSRERRGNRNGYGPMGHKREDKHTCVLGEWLKSLTTGILDRRVSVLFVSHLRGQAMSGTYC